ncbi:hypothetical protein BU17DRAFT_64865 [Hysterangium stoloniferum]|nr:hypothetical protein BU17DRAFT_64865 [Hysterangium stoloniferum]
MAGKLGILMVRTWFTKEKAMSVSGDVRLQEVKMQFPFIPLVERSTVHEETDCHSFRLENAMEPPSRKVTARCCASSDNHGIFSDLVDGGSTVFVSGNSSE